jgi:hypothetical protein
MDNLISNFESIKISDIQNEELIEFLRIKNKIWRMEIELEKSNTKNIPLAFIGIGNFGENICSLISGKLGSGSKGGCAFDLINKENTKADEVKTICLIQPKSCNECKIKVPFFQKICLGCNKSNFKKIRDSRAGINVFEHFKYEEKFENYWIVIIDLIHEIEEIIEIKIYKIDAKNEYFRKLLKTQLEKSNSRTTNLLPYSYDFYASGPELTYEIKLYKDNIDLKKNMKTMEFDTCVLTKKEKELYQIDKTIKKIEYIIIKDKLQLRSKSYNKPRGNLIRNNLKKSENKKNENYLSR